MLRLFIDQDFDQDILRGLIRRAPSIDAVTAHEVGLSVATDPDILAWAAENGRVILTHDRKTMPRHAADRLAAGDKIAGLVVVSRLLPISSVISDLEVIVTCSADGDLE